MLLGSRRLALPVLIVLPLMLTAFSFAGISPKEVREFEVEKAKAIGGDSIAQLKLGFCYQTSRGVKMDAAEAAKWYRKSAEQGGARAQSKLGDCYANGFGVVKDIAEAMRWYRAAAEQGIAGAQYNLGQSYRTGEGSKKDLGEAVKWYRKSAEQGFIPALKNLGVCYANGDGVDQNLAEAYACFVLVGQADDDARNNLAALEKALSPRDKVRARQRAKEIQEGIGGGLVAPDDLLKEIEYETARKGA